MTNIADEHIGKYRLIESIGSGGMSRVYRAEDSSIGRIVALKVLVLPAVVTDEEREEMVLRFEREARSAGRLAHINIVTVYEVGVADGSHYIAMELLEGKTLRQLVASSPLYPKEILRIINAVATGLDYAHGSGVVHRDVKPDNITVLASGLVKLTDFGIARLANDLVRTQAGIMVGSPAYMSPEQITSEDIDGRSDVFSLATTAWEMFCRHKPFDAPNVAATLHKIVYEEPEPNPMIPEVLFPVFRKAFAKDPVKRYQSCRHFAEELGLKLTANKLVSGDMFRQPYKQTEGSVHKTVSSAPASEVVRPRPTTQHVPKSFKRPYRVPIIPAILTTVSIVAICAVGINSLVQSSGAHKRIIPMRPAVTLAPVATNHVLSDFEISKNNWQMESEGFSLNRVRSRASQGSYWLKADRPKPFNSAVISLTPEQRDLRKFGNTVAIDVMVPNEADTDCYAQLFIVDKHQRRHPLGQADRLRPGEWGSLIRPVDGSILADVQQLQLEVRPTNGAVNWFGIDHLRVFSGQ